MNNKFEEDIIDLRTQITHLENKNRTLLEPQTLKTLGTDILNDTPVTEYSKLIYEELRNKETETDNLKSDIERLKKENENIKYKYEQVKLKMMNLFTS